MNIQVAPEAKGILANLESAYLAGLIDGEGYMALLPSRAKGLKVQSFEPVIKIGMTGDSALEIMLRVQEQYGGNIELRKLPTKGGRKAFIINLTKKARSV